VGDEMVKRLLVIALLMVSLIPVLSIGSRVSVPEVSAHATDCPVYVSGLVQYAASGIIDGFARIDCHSSKYRLTMYICGGPAGCRSVSTATCSLIVGCSKLTASGTCTVRYSGPYTSYGGAYLQNYNLLYDRWENGKWTWGPTRQTQGAC
jgi:hypothetical protein